MAYLKKLILLLFIPLVFTCSDDADSSNSNGNSINPPSWLQGLWVYEDGSYGYEFRSDDFCTYLPIGQVNYTCYKSQVELHSATNSSVIQSSTENSYELDIVLISYEYHYEFIKISENSIRCIGCLYDEDQILIKQ